MDVWQAWGKWSGMDSGIVEMREKGENYMVLVEQAKTRER